MLVLLLIIASLLGYCLFIRQRFGLQAEETPILAVAAVILALYVFALANLLTAAVYALLAAGLVLLAWVLLENRKALGKLAAGVFSPGMVLFITGIPVIYLIFNQGTLTQWDEFSHWGLAAKALYLSAALPRGDTILTFPAYVPGTALFQFFFCRLMGWREGLLKVAHLVIVWAAVIAFTRKLKWRQFPVVLLALAVCFVCYIHANETMHRIQVDGLLGMLMGAAFALYYRPEGSAPSNIYKTVPVLALLVIVKDSGIYLAVMLCLIMAADQFILRKRSAEAPGDKNFLRRHPAATAIALAVLTFAVFHESWSAYLKITGIYANLNMVHANYVVQFHAVPNPQVIPMFLDALFSVPVGFPPNNTASISTAAVLIALFFACMSLLIFTDRDKENRKRTALIAGSLLAAMLIYAVGIVFMFMYMFSPYEGSRLASYDRYFGTFFLAMFLCVLCLALDRLGKAEANPRGKWLPASVPVAIFLLFTLITPPSHLAKFWLVYDEPINARAYATPLQQRLNKIAAPGDRVYLVFEGQNPKDFYTFKYDLYPRPTNVQAWNIGNPVGYTDAWVTPMSAAQWSQQLAGYQYVYIGNADVMFEDQFGMLFENGNIRNNTLYGVNTAPGGQVLLKPIG